MHQLGQTKVRMIWLAIGLGSVFAIATMWLGISLFEASSSGQPGLGVLTLALIMFLVGVGVPFYIQERISPSKYFSGDSQTRINSEGISIAQLGTAPWPSVLSLEGIPDSDSAIIVHTSNLGKLLLRDTRSNMLEHILPALQSHLHKNISVDFDSETEMIFRVIPFNLTSFRIQIASGYVLGGIAGIAGAIGGSSILKSLVAFFIFPIMIAYLIWMFPIWNLSFGCAKKVTALRIRDGRLVSVDGKMSIELKNVTAIARVASGIGYSFNYITLKLQNGAKLHFMAYDNFWGKFVLDLLSASGYPDASKILEQSAPDSN